MKEATRLISRILGYTEEVLYEGICPKCKLDIKAHAGIHPVYGLVYLGHIERRDYDYWLGRKKVDFKETVEKKIKIHRPSRQAMYVGEYTMRISRGIKVEIKRYPPPLLP